MDGTSRSIKSRLLALSLVAGVLVDDAIVEIENIVRHMRMGKSCYQAAIDAADEIGLAVVATSFTIIAVFLPVSFMGGVSGQFFKQFGLTVAVAVFISLMVARLITPVLAAYALRGDSLPMHNTDGPIMTRYCRCCKWCVANRWKTMSFAGTVFFVLSIGALGPPEGLHPAEDLSSFRTYHRAAPGRHPGGHLAGVGRRGRHPQKSPEVTDIVEFVGGDDGEIRNGDDVYEPGAALPAPMSQKSGSSG
jgi:multidrug efflux pump subunit AcrB